MDSSVVLAACGIYSGLMPKIPQAGLLAGFFEPMCGHFCGVTEIRTRDTLLAYTRFPGVPLQPLEHHSLFLAPRKLRGGWFVDKVTNFF